MIREREAFRGPSALDLYADFSKRYGALIDRRVKQLRDQLAEGGSGPLDPNPSPDARAMWDELDRLRYFEQDLHLLIRVCVDEAVKPLQDVLVAAMDRYPPPPPMFELVRKKMDEQGTSADVPPQAKETGE